MTERQSAHTAVTTAVGEGKLPPASSLHCVQCGREASHYHHYEGYSLEQRFAVFPLCRSCHTKAHFPRKPRGPNKPKKDAPPASVAPVAIQPVEEPSEEPSELLSPRMEEEPLTVSEIATRLRVTAETVRRWIRTGQLRARRFGGQTGYRISPAEVRRFMEEKKDDGSTD